MYTYVANLLGGVDRTREIYALEPGALWEGINGHLTRGGDFEKRKAFVEFASLPGGTYGMERASGSLYVFGSAPDPGMPAGVLYQRLQHPDGVNISKVLSTDVYAGQIYAVAEYADGSVMHFYDGALVLDWINGVARAAMTDNSGIAAHLGGLMVSTVFSVGVAANVITITHNTLNVPFTNVSAETINVTGGTNDQTAVAVKTVAAAPGVAEVWTITIGGTFEPGDRFTVIVNSVKYGSKANPSPIGKVVKTHGRKVYAGSGRILNFSGVDNATLWNREDDAGAGFEDVSTHESEFEEVTGLGKFLSYLAVLSENSIQVWDVQPDETNNVLFQTIGETGTRAAKSVRNFGDLDMFYLSESGIRSLRARAQNQLAGVNDVGTPIDSLVLEQKAVITDAQWEDSCSTVDSLDARFWMAIAGKIFVFTYFPAKKVSGWSWYEPGFNVTDLVSLNGRVYARSGDKIYIYGGTGGNTYDSCKVTAQMPFLHANKPGTWKNLTGIDIAARGSWTVDLLVNPNKLAEMVHFGVMEGFTFLEENTAGLADFTHAAPRFVHQAGGPASFSALAVYYKTMGDEGG